MAHPVKLVKMVFNIGLLLKKVMTKRMHESFCESHPNLMFSRHSKIAVKPSIAGRGFLKCRGIRLLFCPNNIYPESFGREMEKVAEADNFTFIAAG
jgi:hypothetical protein